MNYYVQLPIASGGGGGVSSLNTLTGALVLVAGSGISVTPAGSNITIAATGTGVTSLNSLTGGLTLVGSTNITITPSGNTLSISATQQIPVVTSAPVSPTNGQQWILFTASTGFQPLDVFSAGGSSPFVGGQGEGLYTDPTITLSDAVNVFYDNTQPAISAFYITFDLNTSLIPAVTITGSQPGFGLYVVVNNNSVTLLTVITALNVYVAAHSPSSAHNPFSVVNSANDSVTFGTIFGAYGGPPLSMLSENGPFVYNYDTYALTLQTTTGPVVLATGAQPIP